MHKSKIQFIDTHFDQSAHPFQTFLRSTRESEFIYQTVGDVLRVSRIQLQVFLRIVSRAYLLNGLQAIEKIRAAHDPKEHLQLNAAYAQYVTDSLVDKF